MPTKLVLWEPPRLLLWSNNDNSYNQVLPRIAPLEYYLDHVQVNPIRNNHFGRPF